MLERLLARAQAYGARPRGPRSAARWTAVAAVAALAFTPAAAARLGDVRFVLDDFEAAAWPDPTVWTVPAAATTWRTSGCQALGGRRGLRAFAPPGTSPDAPCDAAVPPGASSTAFLHLDLRAAGAANRLELGFDVWFRLGAAEDAGLVVWLHVPRPGGAVDRVPIFGATGDTGAWASPQRYLDLRNLVDVRNPAAVYDLRGADWTLEWTAAAPAGAPPGGGVFLDNVALTWEPDLSYPTPTARPTLPPTATIPRPTPARTATPTDEPTPTDIPPTDTATPPAGRAYLPLVRHDPQPTATATVTVTVTATAMVTATATMTATAPAEATATEPTTMIDAANGPAPAKAGAWRPSRPPSAKAPDVDPNPPSGRMLSSPNHAPVAQWTEQLASNQ